MQKKKRKNSKFLQNKVLRIIILNKNLEFFGSNLFFFFALKILPNECIFLPNGFVEILQKNFKRDCKRLNKDVFKVFCYSSVKVKSCQIDNSFNGSTRPLTFILL